MSYILPEQMLPYTKKDEVWRKDNVNYWINQANFSIGIYAEMLTLYRAAEGRLIKSDYNYILNPYGVEDENLLRFPAKLRNYDIISPVVDMFMGEQSKRPDDDQVIAINSDAKNKFTEELNAELGKHLSQIAINTLNDAGLKTDVPSQEVPPIAETAEKLTTSWTDNRAIMGQEALDYIKTFCDFDDKTQQQYYDWLCVGRFFGYKDVLYDDVIYEVVSPLDMWFMKADDSPFIEDGVAVVRRKRMTINQILDRWRSKLSDETIKTLESLTRRISPPADGTGYMHLTNEMMDGVTVNYNLFKGGYLDCYHTVWKSFKQVGTLSYVDKLGQPQTMEVDENYKLDPEHGDIDIAWEWVNEVWGGWCLGGINEGVYIEAEPILVQRNELSNSSVCKLPYNGRAETAINGDIISIVKKGLVYQALHNVMHYKRELTINRNKDKLMLMPIGLIPKQFGKNARDKFMYYADATSMLWFDETKPNANAVLQAIKSIDMGLYQYIEGMNRIIADVKNEWWDCVGVNRQRYGDTQSSDGKAVNEQAIFRSAIISAERNRKFFKTREKELNALLDTSKLAWINGKKAGYITSDRRKAILEIDGNEHLEADYGVFSKNAEEEQKKLEALKNVGTMMAQKGSIPSGSISEIIDANNFAKVKELLHQADELDAQRKAAEAQAANDTQKYIADKASADLDKQLEVEKYVADRRYDAAVDAANINKEAKIETANMDTDGDGNNNSNLSAEVEKLALERQKVILEDQRKRQELASSNANQAADRQVEREKIAAQKQIARSRPKPKTK